MKKIKQLREEYKKLMMTEERDNEKLSHLCDSGLFESKKVNLLKRALKKDVKNLTSAEKKVMNEMIETFMTTLDEQSYLTKLDPRFDKSIKELPAIIVLKKKGVRVFGDNQRIGLYYSQELDKYVSIPFENVPTSMNVGINEAKDDKENYSRLLDIPPSRVDDPSKPKLKVDKKPVSMSRLRGAARREIGKSFASGIDGDPRSLARAGAIGIAYLSGAYSDRKRKEEKPAEPESSPTPKPKPASSDFRNRIKTARRIGREAKASTTLSPEQRAARLRTARRWASYALADKRSGKITESFKNKLNELSARDAADIATDLIPGVSNLKSAGSAISNLTKGNVSAAAIDAITALPGAGNAIKAIRTARKASRLSRRGRDSARQPLDSTKKPESKTEPKVETKPETKKPEPETKKPEPKVEPKAEPKPEAKTEPKVEPKAEPKVEPKPEPKPEPKAEPKPEPKAEPKPEPKAEPKPEAKSPDKTPDTSVEVPVPATTPRSGRVPDAKARPNEKPRRQDRPERKRSADKRKTKVPVPQPNDSDKSEPEPQNFLKTPEFSLKATVSGPEAFDTDITTKRRDERRQRKYLERLTKEESDCVLDKMEKAKKSGLEESAVIMLNYEGNETLINSHITNKVLSLYESLNSENKKKMRNMMNEDFDSFKKVISFAVRQK